MREDGTRIQPWKESATPDAPADVSATAEDEAFELELKEMNQRARRKCVRSYTLNRYAAVAHRVP